MDKAFPSKAGGASELPGAAGSGIHQGFSTWNVALSTVSSASTESTAGQRQVGECGGSGFLKQDDNNASSCVSVESTGGGSVGAGWDSRDLLDGISAGSEGRASGNTVFSSGGGGGGGVGGRLVNMGGGWPVRSYVARDGAAGGGGGGERRGRGPGRGRWQRRMPAGSRGGRTGWASPGAAGGSSPDGAQLPSAAAAGSGTAAVSVSPRQNSGSTAQSVSPAATQG